MAIPSQGWVKHGGVDTKYFIDSSGVKRLLGYLKSPKLHALGASPTLASRGIDVPDPKTIKPFRKIRTNIDILDQIDSNSCVDHGLIVNYMMALTQAGLFREPLSPWFIYTLTNGGVNAPTSPADALLALKTYGSPPDRMVPHGALGPPGYNTEATKVAVDFKLGEWVKLGQNPKVHPFWEAVFCASLGLGVCLGIQAGPAFQTDRRGVVPVLGGDLDHYVVAGEVYGIMADGTPVIGTRGSYGPGWGVNGRGLLQPGHFEVASDINVVLTVNVSPSALLLPTIKG